MDWKRCRLDENSKIPLYVQLKDRIMEQIQDGTLKSEEKLPSESVFCRELAVSRITVRTALNELKSAGYLSCKQGVGTRVSSIKIQDNIMRHINSFSPELKDDNGQLTTKVLRMKKKVYAGGKKEDIYQILMLSTDEPIINLRRVRYSNRLPISYMETWLPGKLCSPLLDCDLEKDPLYDLMEETCDVLVQRVAREIEAVLAPEQIAGYLEIASGTALHRVKSIGYDIKNQPVEYTIAWYRGDVTRFAMEQQRYDKDQMDEYKRLTQRERRRRMLDRPKVENDWEL